MFYRSDCLGSTLALFWPNEAEGRGATFAPNLPPVRLPGLREELSDDKSGRIVDEMRLSASPADLSSSRQNCVALHEVLPEQIVS